MSGDLITSKNLLTLNKLEDIEEEIKNKILLPYLSQIGITPDNISFEKSFSFKLGKNVYKVETTEQIELAQGRLDILCKKGDKNLFVIEVKKQGFEITGDDIDQAISYARLLGQIAPFAMVTNGHVTRIFDTITKEELTESNNIAERSELFSGDYELSIAEDIKLRYEALRHFIGYSAENLRIFCQIQQSNRMQTLKGSVTELEKKYIPELYVNREYINNEFEKFLGNPDVCCFAIIGESGIGKTNSICALAERIHDKHLSLFLNAPDLANGIWEAITDDFNWEFSHEKPKIQLIKDLEGLLSSTCQFICIFIDAIDEATENFGRELDDFINKIINRRFKIVISCKDTEWGRFLKRLGNPTILSQNIFERSDSASFDNEKSGIEKEKQFGLVLRKFTNEELDTAENKYRDIFNFKGRLSGPLRKECSFPFMLRVVSEVYENSDTELPQDTNSIELLNKYLEKKFEKMERSKALRFLTKLGKVLLEEYQLEKPREGHGVKLSEEVIRNKLGLTLNEELYPPLFSHGILAKSSDSSGRNYIDFYYSKVRDYIIAIHSLKLDTLSENEFKNILPKLFKNPVGQSVAYWYYNATKLLIHKKYIEEYENSRALEFIMNYQDIIEDNFLLIKNQFEPYSDGDFGFVYSIHDGFVDYAFRPLMRGEKELVKCVPELLKLRENLNDEFFEFGIRGKVIGSSKRNFLSMSPREFAIEEIKGQLEEIVKNGRLNESNNCGISLEKFLVILDCWGRHLGLFNEVRGRGEFEKLLPIELDDVVNLIKLDYARYHYRNEMENEKIKKTGVTTTSWSSEDYQIIEERAKQAFKKGIEFQRPNIAGDVPPWEALENCIKILLSKYKSIKTTLLPGPDLPKTSRFYVYEDRYSDEQLQKYLQVFYEMFLEEYRILVETNFPTLKEKFELYSKLPVKIVIEIDRFENSSTRKSERGIKYIKIPDQNKNSVEVHINTDGSNPRFEWDSSFEKLRVLTQNEDVESNFHENFPGLAESTLRTYFNTINRTVPISYVRGDRDHGASEHTVLRVAVYENVKKELNEALKLLV